MEIAYMVTRQHTIRNNSVYVFKSQKPRLLVNFQQHLKATHAFITSSGYDLDPQHCYQT